MRELPDVDDLDVDGELVEAPAQAATAGVAIVDRGGECPYRALGSCTALGLLASPAGAVLCPAGTGCGVGPAVEAGRPSVEGLRARRPRALRAASRPGLPGGAFALRRRCPPDARATPPACVLLAAQRYLAGTAQMWDVTSDHRSGRAGHGLAALVDAASVGLSSVSKPRWSAPWYASAFILYRLPPFRLGFQT